MTLLIIVILHRFQVKKNKKQKITALAQLPVSPNACVFKAHFTDVHQTFIDFTGFSTHKPRDASRTHRDIV